MKQWTVFAAGFALAAGIFGAPRLFGADEGKPVQAKPVFSEKLPNVPGKTITGVLVKYAPGAKSSSHAHAGSAKSTRWIHWRRADKSLTRKL